MTMGLEDIPTKLNELDLHAPREVFEAISVAIRERDRLRGTPVSKVEWQGLTERAERAEAELAALKARTEWQPIATAPKDETWIYVCRAGQPHSGTKVKFSRDCGGCPESWWDGSRFYRNPTFTHWMPLPPPPEGED